MRRVSTQKGPIAFISGNETSYYARYKFNIVPSKPSFPRLGFFPDLLNKFGKKSRKSRLSDSFVPKNYKTGSQFF
jgi:hypothetical protein